MLPLQGAGGYLARKTQGGAIGLMINMAFSHSKTPCKGNISSTQRQRLGITTWQHTINPTAVPWDTTEQMHR